MLAEERADDTVCVWCSVRDEGGRPTARSEVLPCVKTVEPRLEQVVCNQLGMGHNELTGRAAHAGFVVRVEHTGGEVIPDVNVEGVMAGVAGTARTNKLVRPIHLKADVLGSACHVASAMSARGRRDSIIIRRAVVRACRQVGADGTAGLQRRGTVRPRGET